MLELVSSYSCALLSFSVSAASASGRPGLASSGAQQRFAGQRDHHPPPDLLLLAWQSLRCHLYPLMAENTIRQASRAPRSNRPPKQLLVHTARGARLLLYGSGRRR